MNQWKNNIQFYPIYGHCNDRVEPASPRSLSARWLLHRRASGAVGAERRIVEDGEAVAGGRPIDAVQQGLQLPEPVPLALFVLRVAEVDHLQQDLLDVVVARVRVLDVRLQVVDAVASGPASLHNAPDGVRLVAASTAACGHHVPLAVVQSRGPVIAGRAAPGPLEVRAGAIQRQRTNPEAGSSVVGRTARRRTAGCVAPHAVRPWRAGELGVDVLVSHGDVEGVCEWRRLAQRRQREQAVAMRYQHLDGDGHCKHPGRGTI